ncbi:MAG TPA: outer membrane beta-barrel protein [Candidatus Acidoferrales bacterium]|nr:outer membrane beta-barrel protein [Candidatus Acidoferrales bacterium]
MSCRKTLLVAFLLALFAVPGAFAQGGFGQGMSQHEFEITPFGGYKLGGKIDLPPGTSSPFDYLPIKSSVDYGLEADYSLFPNLQAEFQFNHQPTDVDGHLIAIGGDVPLTSASINMYQFGFIYDLKPTDAKLKPFFGAGLGFTTWKPYSQLPVDSKTFSYNVGGGVKYFFNKYLGVRFDARWSPSRTTVSQQQFCDYYFGYCGVTPVYAHAEQFQLNGGLILRFHSSYGAY